MVKWSNSILFLRSEVALLTNASWVYFDSAYKFIKTVVDNASGDNLWL